MSDDKSAKPKEKRWPTFADSLLTRLHSLRSEAFQQPLTENNLEELTSILLDIRMRIFGTDQKMAEAMNVSARTIGRIFEGHLPKKEIFLRIINGALTICEDYETAAQAKVDSGPSFERLATQRITAYEWKNVSRQKLHRKISALTNQLDEILLMTRGTNQGVLFELTEIQRTQLIKALETALALLKAPMVEIGILQRVGGWLTAIGKHAAKTELESAISATAEKAEGMLGDFVDSL